MKRTNLGEFEEIVLLVIAAFNKKAYGLSIKNEIEDRTGRKVSMGALYTALSRLEEKGYAAAFWGEATKERGGKRKKFFFISTQGKKALMEAKTLRDELWQLSDKIIWQEINN